MELIRTDHGYLQVSPLPSREDLSAYYRDRYYDPASSSSAYAQTYTPDERRHKQLPAQEIMALVPAGRTVFELGVGEGFVLGALKEAGWDVAGVDFTRSGLEMWHPNLVESVFEGDGVAIMEQLHGANRRFDVVVCNNVLEHVLDPVGVLRQVRNIIAPGGRARIVVPNDDSLIQRTVIGHKLADDQFWLHYPDHLNYFTFTSMAHLLEAEGWQIEEMLGDFPIDLFLLNPDSNYVLDPERGVNCQAARIAAELAIADRGIPQLLEFRRGCAGGEIGRNVVVYTSPAS